MPRLLIYLCALFLPAKHAFTQNLLANGGFEEVNICSEYRKDCAPEAWITTTLTADNYFENSGDAHGGRRFTSVNIGNSRNGSSRSFLCARLLCRLRKGSQYQLEFFVRSRHNALDSLGAYFGSINFLYDKRSFAQVPPRIVYRDTSTRKEDFNKWKRISLTYTATGDEMYFAIGSFKRKDHDLSRGPDFQGDFYIYIDDVSLTPIDKNELLCDNAQAVKNEIYSEDERHQLLLRKVTHYRRTAPPVPTEMPKATTLLKIDTLIIPDILFATGSARLNQSSFGILDSLCAAMNLKPFDSLIVAGHTDSVGTLIYNTKLSSDRSQAVAEYIKAKVKMLRGQLLVRYHAYLQPVASNKTPEGRQRNRRVEVFLYRSEK